MTRVGATKRPAYRVIAIDKRRSRDGRALEILGYYDPLTEPATVNLDRERIDAWIGKGAQPSETVAKLMRQAEKAAQAPAEAEKPKRATRTAKPKASAKATAKAKAEPEVATPAEEAPAEAAEAPAEAAEAPGEAQATDEANAAPADETVEPEKADA
ncbi:MAG: 30S ribosomal protein S16 [Candidatus Limnocylindria bacterium]